MNPQLPIHGEAFRNGDCTAGVSLSLYQQGADVTATLAGSAALGVAITDINFVTEAGGDILLAADANVPGETIAGGTVGATGGIVRSLRTPHYCKRGKVPRMFGPATGKTRCVIHGFLYRG